MPCQPSLHERDGNIPAYTIGISLSVVFELSLQIGGANFIFALNLYRADNLLSLQEPMFCPIWFGLSAEEL